jgi:hypothetical protein
MAFDDDDAEEREEKERFNQLVDRLNALVQDEHPSTGTRALCIALRHALFMITDLEERSRRVAICMNTLEDIPALDRELVDRHRGKGPVRRLSYRDTREP